MVQAKRSWNRLRLKSKFVYRLKLQILKTQRVSKFAWNCLPPLIYDHQNIQEVTNHKHLGLHITKDLHWDLHVQNLLTKASQRLSILRKFQFRLDRKSLEKLYLSFVRPVIEYADIIWDNLPDNLAQKIEKCSQC